MYTLYTADTPNGRKITIALEELELPYEVRHVDLGAGEQHAPDFLAVSPNNKIPAIVRHADGHATFESGAILIELADRAGHLLPADGPERSRVLSWLFMQVGSVGPMLGQLWWFRHAGPANAQALERYEREVRRIYGVVERRLAESSFIGTSAYGIADIAMYPWLASHEELGIAVDAYPNVARWIATVAARPAVVRGLRKAVPPARAAA